MRPRVVPLVVASVLALGSFPACSGAADQPEGPGTVVEGVATLQEGLADLASTQQRIDRDVARSLRAVLHLARTASDLRSAATVDAAVERWKEAPAAVGIVGAPRLRRALGDLATDVEAVRLRLAQVAAPTTWHEDYRVALDTMLEAVMAWAKATDTLAQQLEGARATVQALAKVTDTFVTERWFYRDPDEAADAYEVQAGDRVRELAAIERRLAAARRGRDAAAQALNEATADAAAEFERGPAG